MFLSIDVVQKVDGIFDNTVTDIAVVTSRLWGRCVFVDNYTFTQLGVKINFVVTLF